MQRLGRVVGGAPVVLVVPSVATPEVRFSSTSVSPCVARWIRSSRGSPSLAVVAQAAIIMRTRRLEASWHRVLLCSSTGEVPWLHPFAWHMYIGERE